jgi:hypothetical protein
MGHREGEPKEIPERRGKVPNEFAGRVVSPEISAILEAWTGNDWLTERLPGKAGWKMWIKAKIMARRQKEWDSEEREMWYTNIKPKVGPLDLILTSLEQTLRTRIMTARANTFGFRKDKKGSKAMWDYPWCIDCTDILHSSLPHDLFTCGNLEAQNSQKKMVTATTKGWPKQRMDLWERGDETLQICMILRVYTRDQREKDRLQSLGEHLSQVEKRAKLSWDTRKEQE